jgi:release factor glutamine methyltransferase
MTLDDILNLAKSLAKGSGIIEADYLFIVEAILGQTRSQMLLHKTRKLEPEKAEILRQAFTRLESGEPPQYICGKTWFRNLELEVEPAVLIPRPETELLIDILLSALEPGARILEIGTGSGAIAIALKTERPDLQIEATDISEAALRVASSNAVNHQAVLKFHKANLFPQRAELFDCLVSNPPYISTVELAGLDNRVKAFEPVTALWGGEDGLDFYRELFSMADRHLKIEGMIAVEHGSSQRTALIEIASQQGWNEAEAYVDLCGRDRFLIFKKTRNNSKDI